MPCLALFAACVEATYSYFRTLLLHGLESDWLEEECDDDVFRDQHIHIILFRDLQSDHHLRGHLVEVDVQEGRAGAEGEPGLGVGWIQQQRRPYLHGAEIISVIMLTNTFCQRNHQCTAVSLSTWLALYLF